MAAAQQRDDQSADGSLLPDDGLGEFGAQRQERISCRFSEGGLGGRWLCHVCATCLSISSSARASCSRSLSVAGGGPNRWWETNPASIPLRLLTVVTTAGAGAPVPRPSRGSSRCPVAVRNAAAARSRARRDL